MEEVKAYKIVYVYKRKVFVTVTKPCTLAAAQIAFAEEVNAFGNCKLLSIAVA